MEQKLLNKIKLMAKNMRQRIIDMTYVAGSSGAHLGGALSMVEILATLYGGILRYDINNPLFQDRDRFILSKGHSGLALYSVLAEIGMLTNEDINSFQKNDSYFTTHPIINRQKGIEFSNGSLGMGLALGIGEAIAAKRRNQSHRVFVCIGDGECNEGSVWEAIMSAAHFQLNNIVAVIDKNSFQMSAKTEDIMNTAPLPEKFLSFGWQVVTVEGHDIESLFNIFNPINNSRKPLAVIANTVKGKGVTFSENNNAWHHSVMTKSQYEAAIAELQNKK
jgi:transketolase